MERCVCGNLVELPDPPKEDIVYHCDKCLRVIRVIKANETMPDTKS
jgi:hypothetical protein